MFAPPSKSCRFSHPPSPRAGSMAQGISLSADSDSGGSSPPENLPPAALSWSSLFGATVLRSFRFCTMLCVVCFCRDTASRVCQFHKTKICFRINAYSVENVPPERFQNQETASGIQGGAVLFAPPSKSCRFSHPPSPRAGSMAQGISLSADSDSGGSSPPENLPPAALSWSSLFGATVLKSFRFRTMLFVPCP